MVATYQTLEMRLTVMYIDNQVLLPINHRIYILIWAISLPIFFPTSNQISTMQNPTSTLPPHSPFRQLKVMEILLTKQVSPTWQITTPTVSLHQTA